MRTIFGLFNDYHQASAAVKTLLDREFPQEEMNVLVDEDTVKTHVEADLSKAGIEKTKGGGNTTRGLDRMVTGTQPLRIHDAGRICSAGKLATVLARTASREEQRTIGSKGALVDFGVSPEEADIYVSGLRGGGVLFFLRVQDELAPEAANVLREQGAVHVHSYAR
jgi:hypothetical protein